MDMVEDTDIVTVVLRAMAIIKKNGCYQGVSKCKLRNGEYNKTETKLYK